MLPFRNAAGLVPKASSHAEHQPQHIWERRGANGPRKLDFDAEDRGVRWKMLTAMWTPRYLLHNIEVQPSDIQHVRQFIEGVSEIIRNHDGVHKIFTEVLEENEEFWWLEVGDEETELAPEQLILLMELFGALDIFHADEVPERMGAIAEDILKTVQMQMGDDSFAELDRHAVTKVKNRKMYMDVVQRLRGINLQGLPLKDPVAETDTFKELLKGREACIVGLFRLKKGCGADICGTATRLFASADMIDRMYEWLEGKGYRISQHDDSEGLPTWSRLNPEADEFFPALEQLSQSTAQADPSWVLAPYVESPTAVSETHYSPPGGWLSSFEE